MTKFHELPEQPTYFEPNALKEWKVIIFKIMDQRIIFYLQNANLLPLNFNVLSSI